MSLNLISLTVNNVSTTICLIVVLCILPLVNSYAASEKMNAKIHFLTPVSMSNTKLLWLGPLTLGDGISNYTVNPSGMKQSSGQSGVFTILGNNRGSVGYSCTKRRVEKGFELQNIRLSSYNNINMLCKNRIVRSHDAPNVEGQMLAVGMDVRLNEKLISENIKHKELYGMDIIIYTHID